MSCSSLDRDRRFQIGVSRGRGIAFNGRLVQVWCDLLHMRRAGTGLPILQLGSSSVVVIEDIVEWDSIESQVASQASDLFSIAVFCGFGLLVSLSVLLLDQYVPGDWF